MSKESKTIKPFFLEFLSKFPEVSLPIIIGEDSHHTFSTENPPLSHHLIELFIQPIQKEEDDEFTEYLPCFLLPEQENYYALVYWRAGLLRYEYFIATFDKKGELIQRKGLAYTAIDGDTITRSVATFNEDMLIFVAEGTTHSGDDGFEAETAKHFNMEILSSGEMISYNAALN